MLFLCCFWGALHTESVFDFIMLTTTSLCSHSTLQSHTDIMTFITLNLTAPRVQRPTGRQMIYWTGSGFPTHSNPWPWLSRLWQLSGGNGPGILMREELKKNRRLLFPVCKGCAQIQGKKVKQWTVVSSVRWVLIENDVMSTFPLWWNTFKV